MPEKEDKDEIVQSQAQRLAKYESKLVSRGLGELQNLDTNKPIAGIEARAWVSKGIEYQREARYDDAITCFDRATEIDARCAEAWDGKAYSVEMRALLLGYPDEIARYRNKITRVVVEYYDKAIELEPAKAEFYINKGTFLMVCGRLEKAIMCFDSALIVSPNSISALIGKGGVLSKLSREFDALQCYDKILEQDTHGDSQGESVPDFKVAWSAKAKSLYRLGRHVESVQCCDRVIRAWPDEILDVWEIKGDNLMELGKYVEAISCYDRFVLRFSDFASGWSKKAICLYMIGQFEASLECAEKALSSMYLTDSKSHDWYQKGLVQEKLDRVFDAIESYQQVVNMANPTQDPRTSEIVNRATERLRELKLRKTIRESIN